MATGLRPGTEGTNVLKEIWTSEWYLNPTEESVAAEFVTQPNGVQKFGNKLHLRKLKAIPALSLGATTSAESLTETQNTEVEVQVTPTMKYAFVSIGEHLRTRIIDDGPFQAGVRKQMLAGITEAIDTDLLALSASLSHTESGADVDKAMFLSAVGQLAEYGKGHIQVGKSNLLCIVHPREYKNVMGISEFVNAQFRGDGANPAVSGWTSNAYGIKFKESGLVYNPAGTAYQPLIDAMAWVLAWNVKPTLKDVQPFLLADRLVAYAEYGVNEFFDEYGVSLNTTV